LPNSKEQTNASKSFTNNSSLWKKTTDALYVVFSAILALESSLHSLCQSSQSSGLHISPPNEMAENSNISGVQEDAKMTIASEMFEPYHASLWEPETHPYVYGTSAELEQKLKLAGINLRRELLQTSHSDFDAWPSSCHHQRIRLQGHWQVW
jgi:hypothetical protein